MKNHNELYVKLDRYQHNCRIKNAIEIMNPALINSEND
jgi:hypothetical protein